MERVPSVTSSIAQGFLRSNAPAPSTRVWSGDLTRVLGVEHRVEDRLAGKPWWELPPPGFANEGELLRPDGTVEGQSVHHRTARSLRSSKGCRRRRQLDGRRKVCLPSPDRRRQNRFASAVPAIEPPPASRYTAAVAAGTGLSRSSTIRYPDDGDTVLEHVVASFVAAVRSDPTLSDDDLVDVLVRGGMGRLDAERTLAFVPMGFEHERLSHKGAGLPAAYEVRDPDSGRSRKGMLSEVPYYMTARAFARREGLEHPDVALVAGRSAEAAVVRQLGDDPAAIVLTEPVLLRLPVEDESSPLPWWRRW